MKRLQRTVWTALQALRRNTLRAALTALGIIIGIGSVIVMMEIGRGSSAAIAATIRSMGANTLVVLPGAAASGGISFGAGSKLTLTADDTESIRDESPAVRAAAPIVRSRRQVVFQERNWIPQDLYGTTPDFVIVRDWRELAEGQLFTERDVQVGARVCLVGQTIVRELFGGVSPIGKEVRIQNVSMKVIGVLAAKGANMMGSDQDDVLIAPWTTIKYRISGNSTGNSGSGAASTPSTSSSATSPSQIFPASQIEFYPPAQGSSAPMLTRAENVDQILVSASDADSVDAAVDQITALLRDRHHIRPDEPDDFSVRNNTEMAKAFTSTTTLMTNLLLVVACISLVVGGVGIMNIMLVSVTERTREIGLRMAVGAKSRDILEQFLIEAVVLCLFGGTLGILLGRGASALVSAVLHWPVEASVEAVVASTVISLSVGLVFGYFPAAKASQLDPIEALRYE